jgi:flavin-dependent thymidylate synthase
MTERKHIEIVAATERDPARAAGLLIFTKHTRLAMDGASLEEIINKCSDDPDWMYEELGYMAKTIRSSWEFLDITFSMRDVSRACAQQITRTRFTPIDGDLFGSYAMQSQRVTDMSEATWHNPFRGRENKWDHEREFDSNMEVAMDAYRSMTDGGSPAGSEMKLEDARGILPVNLHCNLIAKYNLRMLVDLIQARSSYRAQGEFNVLAREMREALIEMWPWAELFLRPKDELAAEAYSDVLRELDALGGDAKATHPLRIALAKLNDIVQGGK